LLSQHYQVLVMRPVPITQGGEPIPATLIHCSIKDATFWGDAGGLGAVVTLSLPDGPVVTGTVTAHRRRHGQVATTVTFAALSIALETQLGRWLRHHERHPRLLRSLPTPDDVVPHDVVRWDPRWALPPPVAHPPPPPEAVPPSPS
jgi:hypothetical protein